MKKSPFIFTLLICASAQAGVINLGSIITDNISVLGYASAFPTTSSIAVTNVGSTINVTGNLVSPNLTGTSGVTFTAGSGTPAITATEENDLASVVTQLNSLSYTSLTLTAGTNTIATPGDYTINGTPPAGAVINLTGNGTYVFKTTGNTALNLTNVTVNANANLLERPGFLVHHRHFRYQGRQHLRRCGPGKLGPTRAGSRCRRHSDHTERARVVGRIHDLHRSSPRRRPEYQWFPGWCGLSPRTGQLRVCVPWPRRSRCCTTVPLIQ